VGVAVEVAVAVVVAGVGVAVVAAVVAVVDGVGVAVVFPGSVGCDVQPAMSMQIARNPAIRMP
jgi:hypothetical protein